MRRAHILGVSVLLSVAAVLAAYATTQTLRLGQSTKQVTTRAPDTVVAKRKQRLDRWEAALKRANAKKPPPLPRVPHFPTVHIPTAGPIVIPRVSVPVPHVSVATFAPPPAPTPVSQPTTAPAPPVSRTAPSRVAPATTDKSAAKPRDVGKPTTAPAERTSDETKRLKEEVKAKIAPLEAEKDQLKTQVEQLKTEERQLKDQLKSVKREGDGLEGDAKKQFKAERIEPLEAQVEQLKAQEEPLKARIEALEAQIEQAWKEAFGG
jgi:chaperonin cofactor prefoldin